MPSACNCSDRRRHDGVVLLAERAVLAGMRVEPGDRDARARDAEAGGEVARDDAAGLDDEVAGQARHHVAQRQVDGHRHHRELRRPQHHHRMHGLAGRLGGELGEEFGMARLGKAGAIKHVLGDRIGDHGGGAAGHHIGDRAADRGDRRRRAAGVGIAGRGGDRQAERDDRQSALEGGVCFLRRDDGERHIEAEERARARQKIRIADEVERRHVEFDPAPPDGERQIGADACRLAERQRQRKPGARAHLLSLYLLSLYSIIACLRISSRYFLASAS